MLFTKNTINIIAIKILPLKYYRIIKKKKADTLFMGGNQSFQSQRKQKSFLKKPFRIP